MRCCYFIENSFRELNFKQLDLLFGDEIRNGGIQKNEQVLGNGIQVPIAPPSFINEVLQKNEQKKRRILYAQKIKKKNLKDMNAMLWFFNMSCAPTREESFESLHVIPPNLLRTKNPKKRITQEDQTLRARTIQLLEITRSKIKNHPVYNKRLDTSIFQDIDSVADLLKVSVNDESGKSINISQHLISMYDILFPINN